LIVLVSKKFHSIKSEIRILGIDDGRFVPHTKGKVEVVGVVYRGAYWFEGIMCTRVKIDGVDATRKISNMICNSNLYGEIRIVLLNGLTFAGFNVVDIKKLFQKTKLPVISIVRKKPDLNEIKKAIKNLPDFEFRWKAMENAGELFTVKTRNGYNPIYIQKAGILFEDATKILKKASIISNVPEPLRVSHIIASGLICLKEKV
jgi:endonuclease V-like protein UPF0215 family